MHGRKDIKFYSMFVRCLLVFLSKTGSTVEHHVPDAGHPDRLGCSGKFVENSTKLTYLEITGCRIKYITVLRLVELQIRRGRKV